MKNIFCIRLEEVRGGMSQRQFADFIGVKPSTYSAWERGVIDPASSNIIVIARAKNISSDWLLGLSDEKHPLKSGGSATATGEHGTAISGGATIHNNHSPAPDLATRVKALEDQMSKVIKQQKNN